MRFKGTGCFYIYEYRDPATGRPLYVGKGTGNRAWSHINCTLVGEISDAPPEFRQYLSDALRGGTPPEVFGSSPSRLLRPRGGGLRRGGPTYRSDRDGEPFQSEWRASSPPAPHATFLQPSKVPGPQTARVHGFQDCGPLRPMGPEWSMDQPTGHHGSV